MILVCFLSSDITNNVEFAKSQSLSESEAIQ